MSHRIDRCFAALAKQGRSALIPFMTAGDPRPEWTVGIMHALANAGCDLLELGVPFSDPAADGPVIQAASERAIAQGVSLCHVLGFVREFRRENQETPVVLMGYLNPIERYGHAAFAQDAEEAGVDGILMVDCPPEEMHDLRGNLDPHGIYPICLVAPTTTDERMGLIAQQARGYLYYVSFKGITGANRLDAAALTGPVQNLRRHTSLPLAVGFGIKDAESAAAVAAVADGVVIGSALVSTLSQSDSADDARARAAAFVAPIRAAMDNTRS